MSADTDMVERAKEAGRKAAAGMDERIPDCIVEAALDASGIGEMERALSDAAESLEHLSRWRRDARAHDEDMGHEPRDFIDDEDWDMVEEYAAKRATSARAVLSRARATVGNTHE